MKRPENLSRLLVLLGLLIVGRAACAQPSIPKERIPADLPAEVRQNIEGLYSADAQQRARAARRLVGQPHETAPAIPFLIAMLHDNAVLHSKAELMRLDMISSYSRVFSYPNTPGEHAAETLARIGRREVRPMLDALLVPLKARDSAGRANAIRALGEMLRMMEWEGRMPAEAGRVLEPLMAALSDRDPNAREYAAVVLGKLASPRAIGPLIAVLQKDRSEGVRAAVAAALGAVKDPRPVGPLIAVLGNPFEAVEARIAAAQALGKIGDPRAARPLTVALEDKDWRLRRAALAVAGVVRDLRRLRPLLIDALQDEQWRVRAVAAHAARALGELNDPAAFEVLAIALGDKQPNVRASAVRALAELKDPRVFARVVAVLREDQNSYVRWHAAAALGELGDPRAVEPLTAALKDEDEIVRKNARRALEKIKKKAAQLPPI